MSGNPHLINVLYSVVSLRWPWGFVSGGSEFSVKRDFDWLTSTWAWTWAVCCHRDLLMGQVLSRCHRDQLLYKPIYEGFDNHFTNFNDKLNVLHLDYHCPMRYVYCALSIGLSSSHCTSSPERAEQLIMMYYTRRCRPHFIQFSKHHYSHYSFYCLLSEARSSHSACNLSLKAIGIYFFLGGSGWGVPCTGFSKSVAGFPPRSQLLSTNVCIITDSDILMYPRGP